MRHLRSLVALLLFLGTSTSTAQEAPPPKADEELRALAAFFEGASRFEAETLKVTFEDGLRLLGSSPLVTYSRHKSGAAIELVRRVSRGIRFSPDTGDVVWAEVAAGLRELSLEFSFVGGGTASLKIHNGSGASLFVRADDKGFRIAEIRRERERTLSHVDFAEAVTGGYTLSVTCDLNDLRVCYGAGENKQVLKQAIPWKGSSQFALGAQDGALTITKLRCSLALDRAWWSERRASALAHAALIEFRKHGAHTLFSGLAAKLSGERIDRCLTAYSDVQRAMRDRGEFEALARTLPENELACFEAAKALAEVGSPAAALTLLDSIKDPSSASHELGAALALRARNTTRAVEWLAGIDENANVNVLRGIVALRLGDFAKARELFDASDHPLAKDLARAAGRLASMKVGQGLTVHSEGASDAVFALVRAESERYALAYQKILGAHSDTASVDVRLFGRGDDFLSAALPYAHEHIDELGALFVSGSEAVPHRVMLCADVGPDALLTNLRHELWHACCAAALIDKKVLSWVDEGEAVLFSASLPPSSTAEEKAEEKSAWKFLLPAEVQGSVETLALKLEGKDAAMRVRSFVTASPEEFYAGGTDAYALAWILVWALADPSAASVGKLLDAVLSGPSRLSTMSDEALGAWLVQAAKRLRKSFGESA